MGIYKNCRRPRVLIVLLTAIALLTTIHKHGVFRSAILRPFRQERPALQEGLFVLHSLVQAPGARRPSKPTTFSYARLPCSKMAPWRHSLVRTSLPIAALPSHQQSDRESAIRAYLLIHLRTPPMEIVHPAWINKSKEYDHERESEPRIERGG